MASEAPTTSMTSKLTEGIAGWIESGIVVTSHTSIGQALLKLIDSFLWVVEKSVQWSLPSHEVAAEENGKVFGKIELVRPLPWILFLPGLVILRIIRSGLNLGAFILGYPQIQPSGMVRFVQKSRRRLRAINLKAVKSTRSRTSTKDNRLTMIEAKKALIRSIRLTLSTLSCLDTSKSSPSPPPTKIRIGHMDLEPLSTPDEKSTTESTGSPIQADMKRKHSQVSSGEESTDESENETLQSKIDRLALDDDSTDDPDFTPANCSTESSTSCSETDVDQNVSLNEMEDVCKQAKTLFKEDVEKGLLMSLENLESSKKQTEDTTVDATRLDSSETGLQSTSKITNDFINGEQMNCIEQLLPPELAPASRSVPEVTNGVTCQKQNPNVSNYPSSQGRAHVAKEHSSHFEKRGHKHKKGGRRDFK